MPRVAVCFPGQGSQVAGMGADLLDTLEAGRLLEVAATAGLDLAGALRSGDDERLRPTEVAQPALLLVEALLGAAIPGSLEVVGVAGHSVGEYAALVGAGALSDVAAMRLVVARGRVMAAAREGTMAALLGADVELAEALCRDAAGRGAVVVANLNGPGQVVVSGTVAAVAEVERLARERGVRKVIPLRVSGAFHSPLMVDAAEQVAAEIDRSPLTQARVPVACNVDGAAVVDAAGLRDRLRRQLASPVQWQDCVRTLLGLGAEALVEVGPGSVLTGLARRIAPEVPAVAAGSLAEVASLPRRLGAPTRA